MAPLNDQQTEYILSLLEGEGISLESLKEELLDHLCCLVEEQMHHGNSFHDAVEFSFARFCKNEFRELQKQSIRSLNYKKRIMKITSFFALGLLLSFSTIWYFFADPPSINPLKGDYEVTSGFGKRMHPISKVLKLHKGVDFKAPIGTPVLATSDGVVVKAIDKTAGYGMHIIIKHDGQYSTLYSQLSKMEVAEGEKVKKGQIIGAVGNSGTSTGPHLHYEVIKDGENIDPEVFITP